MQLELKFSDISRGPNNKDPEIAVMINDQELYKGAVINLTNLYANPQDLNLLTIHFLNKSYNDTLSENGQIISDLNFNLASINIDNIEFQELIWESKYIADNGNVYPSCLFFGPPGKFEIEFEYPLLKWQLKTRHRLKNDDPNWEEDFNYYVKACKILNKI